MKTVSVKAKVASKWLLEDGQVNLTFVANYTDANGNRVNEEWAKFTPGFSMTMNVKDEDVMVDFENGDEVEILIRKEKSND